MSEEEQSVSALVDNIQKKGTNSYYYAHGKKIEGPAWDGKEEPRLLATTSTLLSPKVLVSTLDTFSWMDGDKSVKIFVDFDGAADVSDEEISLNENNETDSLNFRFKKDDKPYALHITPLHNNISSASFKKKADKFVITLKKEEEGSWSALKKSS